MSSEPRKLFERRFPSQWEALGQVTKEAMGFIEESGLTPQAVYRTNLVIEELATNILKYGYTDAAVHEILLRLELQPEAVLLILEDDGQPFNPLEAPEPELHVPAEERAVGGLGIHLVRQLAEQMTYERCGERNQLTVRIRR